MAARVDCDDSSEARDGDADGLPRSLGQRLDPAQLLTLDIGIAVFLFVCSVLAIRGRESGHAPAGAAWDAIRYAMAALASVALPFRRRRPLVVLGVTAAAVIALLALGEHGPGLTSIGFAVFSAAVRPEDRLPRWVPGLIATGLVGGALVAGGGPQWAAVIAGPAVLGVGWLAGENARARRAFARGIVERARAREREQEEQVRQAAAEERLRIARDLHDVVAHSMSVIAVRSGVGRMVIDDDPEEARAALAIIESVSRDALGEMRRLVGVLRRPDDAGAEAQLAPAPGLDAIDELVRQVDETGSHVDVHVEGERRPLPDGVDVSAYRIVQEALTNVVRHAGPTGAQLRIRYGEDDLEIEVVDDGPATPSTRATAVPPNGSGHGLIGMRERVALYGGDLTAGPAGGGFRVLARLPIDGEPG